MLRPPLANHRLRWLDGGRGKSPTGDDKLLLTLKRTWADGTTHLVLSPSELRPKPDVLGLPEGYWLLMSRLHVTLG